MSQLITKTHIMKLFIVIMILAILPFIIVSCGTTKNGCPTSQDGNPRYKFRG